jgi:hypothetical protein
MILALDLSVVPPGLALLEADDFTALKVVATRPTETCIAAGALEQLAAEAHEGDGWRTDFARMLAYAESRGWVREDGAVQAHVEWS